MDSITPIQSNLTIDKIQPNPPQYSTMQPATQVTICKNVPLDNSYRNTLTFTDASAQLSYFMGKQKYICNALTPVGLNMQIRVPYVADNIYDCNYLIIKNANFTTQTLYAFISKIDYVNISVCSITFEIDVMQTWFFAMNIQACLVEREHVNNDAIASNTLGESLPLGDYKRTSRIRAGVCSEIGVMVTLPADVNMADYNDLTAGIFSGLRQQVFPVQNNSAAPLQDVIQQYVNTGQEGNILAIQMIPTKYYTQRGDSSTKTTTVTIPKDTTALDGYTPKNNKLRQYPYMYLEVDNTQGQVAPFRYEWFNTSDCEFKVYGVTAGDSPELVMIPLNYDGMGTNVMEQLTLGGFPQCAWTGDAYKAYLAHNSMKNAYNIGSGIVNGAANITAGNVLGGVDNLIGTFTNYMQEDHNARIAENKMRGTRGSNSMFSLNYMDFWLTRKTIDASHARAIDDYFTRFGYRVDRIKIPNITGRQSFNYVKTAQSAVTGAIPFNDLAKINNIFDRGITFWHGDYVGDFSRSNNIVGG